MSGSQHNPNGRQSQLGSGWSPLQLQMANLLARAPQAHMANDRGVTWHTPTPPPHLYHVPAPSPPDPLQAMKNVGSNSVFRHTATPPELYRHTPTPPDKHNMMRHTPSPGDVKSGPQMPPVDLFPHLGPARDKLVRAEELLAYARVGVDLSLGSRANGAAPPAAHPAHPSHPAHPALSAHSPALSVRDAPTINSLIGRGGARRVDSLLERLAPAPASPHSVIVHPRAQPTPSPPSSNEDSADSCGAAPGSKRKRKPERTVRLPHPPPAHPAAPSPALAPAPACAPAPAPAAACAPAPPPAPAHSPAAAPSPATDSCGRLSPPAENGVPSPSEAAGAPPAPAPAPAADLHSVRRKTRSGSAETIADIAAMIADGGGNVAPPSPVAPPPLSVDKLKSVLASPEPAPPPIEPCAPHDTGAAPDDTPAEGGPAAAAAPEPAAASFVEVENQLEKMFAALDDQPRTMHNVKETVPARKRRKSAPGRNRSAAARRAGARGKPEPKARRKEPAREGYDSGSNASSGRSRAPYIQIVGPCASPASVVVMNAGAGEEEEASARRGAGAAVRRRGLHASTLGLRYDAATRDASWLCAFCSRGPHAAGLGDLFGPYPLDTDLPDYRALDASARRRIPSEVWVHAACAVWAPGVVAAGARVWGLARATCAAAAERCRHCTRPAAPLACARPRCPARAHLPCAQAHRWLLDDTDCRAHCPAHKD